ncbi:RING finger protein 17 isoform X2 [Ascaphus truei]|uniref:RING finger protein 17 isoform X2 n=1 Tax=Ascaphus truei TaxID=8439 RepID=UPI003F5927BB
MADAERVCAGCTLSAGFSENTLLRCGHVLCELCSADMDASKLLCLACVEFIETESSDYTEDWMDEEFAVEKMVMSSTPDVIKRLQLASTCQHEDVLQKEQMDISQDGCIKSNIQLANENTSLCPEVDAGNFASLDLKCNLSERIDEALTIANSTFQHINVALKTSKSLKQRIKQTEESISNIIQTEFDKISLALQTRKSNLLAELNANRDIYVADLEKAVRTIEEKKNNLEMNVKSAEGLKKTPSLSTYCDLNKLVADLKGNLENDCLSDLVLMADLRFQINSEKIIETVEKLGRIYISTVAECPLIHNGNTVMSNEEPYDLDVSLSLENKNAIMSGKQFEAECVMEQEAQQESRMEQECLMPSESKHSGPRELTSPVSKKSALHQSLSSPDVIIEEIIDEEQSSAALEFSCDTQRRHRKFTQKKSSQFGQKKASSELVFVSHVINPCNFYIRWYRQKRPTIMLEKRLKMFSMTASPCCPSDILELGEIIVIESKEHQLWCRANITELIPLEFKYVGKPCGPTKYKIEDIARMKVFLMDYGSSEVIIVLRFAEVYIPKTEHIQYTVTKDLCQVFRKLNRDSDDQLRQIHPFAVQCSLMDIVPPNSNGCWGPDVKTEFLRMINNKCVLMKVFKEEYNKLIVDLKKPSTTKNSSDMPLSLREAFIHLGLARFRYDPAAENNIQVTVKQYAQPVLPPHLADVPAFMSYMNNPSDFYIHLFDSDEYYHLANKIQEVYNNEGDNLEILCPVMGQACISEYDGEWFRAEVVGLPGWQEVEVKYVDFGNVSRVNVRTLKQILDEFVNIPCKAICSRLAYIEPCNNAQQWSTEACEIFASMTCNKHLRCTPIGILLDNKLSVELFEHIPGKAVTSFNTMLVEEEMASFIPCTQGPNNKCPTMNEMWDPVSDLFTPSSVVKIVTSEKEMDMPSLFSLKELDVRVTNAVSPDKIYIQWLSTEHLLKSLQRKMADVYEKSKPEIVQWQVNMRVAVQLPNNKQWRRAQVINIVSETFVKVFHSDFGVQEVADVNNLRTLEGSLETCGNLCLECSLMNIRPAGGSEKWTATACDVLSCYLNGALASIVIEENSKQWPIPVKMLIKDEAGQLVDISDFLIRKGVALKERRSANLMEVNESSTTVTVESGEGSTSEILSECESEKMVCGTIEIVLPTSDKPMTEEILDEPYLPPVIPDGKIFTAHVSCVGDDGTIYVIQKSVECERNKLMVDIQASFKGHGLLAPYCWKKGEGCLISGPDTKSYRGKVLEVIGGGVLRVQYEDYGYIEKIPKCHLYPSVFNSHIPRFCIPCQLHNTLPEEPKQPGATASVNIYCDHVSVSHILEQHAHCVPEDCEKRTKVGMDYTVKCSAKVLDIDFNGLLLPELTTPLLPRYTLPSLPEAGELFSVTVKHIQTPNQVFICLDTMEAKTPLSDADDSGLNCDFSEDNLESDLKTINLNAENMPCLTDFRSEMPCLAVYTDGQLYRAKLQSITSYDPLRIVVEFVDYGSTSTLETNSLFQLPPNLIQYPAKAIKVKLAGFKPSLDDGESGRLPYNPTWSMKAMWEMMDLLQGKQLHASRLAYSSEVTVYLYEGQHLVHKPLISMGLADLDQ